MTTLTTADPFRQRFGRRLRLLRYEVGLTQEQLAHLIHDESHGITPDGSQISRWEMGRALPSLANQQALAHAFGIDQERLFYDP